MSACTYSSTAKLLRYCSQLLRLPSSVTVTALNYLHRYQQVRKEEAIDKIVVAACIFTATKVEEAHVRTNELLNVVHFAVSKSKQLADQREVLVGDLYSAEKQRLVHAEQAVLRAISFNVGVVQPHKYLLNFCRSIGCSQSIVQVAAFLVNDSLVYTTLCLTSSAPNISAGALLLAQSLLTSGQSLSEGNVTWVELIGLRLCEVLEVAADLLRMIKDTSGQQA